MPESDSYRIYAIKYAHHERNASVNFLGGDPHDGPMPMDYFVWAVVGDDKTFIVDTGFDPEVGQRRARKIVRPVAEGLKTVGVEPDRISDVIVTHMHYDHAGNHALFPNARYHLQDREMAYCTGRCMCHEPLKHAYELADVAMMIKRLFEGRVQFHDGSSEVAPGISVHLVGGHTNGLQIVRVRTGRGWVVLASDASHYFANIEQARPFPVVYNVGDMIEGWATARRLAESPAHIIPGHDPAVLHLYPSPNEALKGWVVRVDAPPR